LSESSIVVVGAGVVGASVALALQQDRHKVTLIDRNEPCAGASFGNAGAVVNASCVPTAMPGAAIAGLRMLVDPLAPLSIRPSYVHSIAPWLARFVLQSRTLQVAENARGLFALTRHAAESWRRITDKTDLSNLLRASGWLKVYGTTNSFAATAASRALMDEIGTPYQILQASDIRELEPNLAPIFARAIFQEDSLSVTDPQRMVQGMVDLFRKAGGTFRKLDLRNINVTDERPQIECSGETLRADKVVLATGAWSKPFAKQVGDRVPLDTERGYHLKFSLQDGELLARPVMNGDLSFVLSPMLTGLRLTSRVEFAGVDAPPDYARIRRLLPYVKRMLPGISGSVESEWMGCRPSLPDSLPVLGVSPNCQHVLYAFGHQHLGITLGPVSGFVIADLVAGREPGVDLTAYRANRF
jgi:D-amino-acid dehydrogenase